MIECMDRTHRPLSGSLPRPLPAAWSVLEKHGWLAERSADVRSVLRAVATTRVYEAGQALYLSGDAPDGVYGLVEGALDVSIPRADGLDLTIHRAESGFWVGDLALIAKQVRLVSVRAAVMSELVYIPQDGIRAIIASRPEIVTDFYALSHRNVQTILGLLGNLSISPSEIRVAWRLLLLDEDLTAGKGWIQLSQEKLAELVALSVPTLQRALRQLETSGLIELGYRRIRVADRVALLRYCGDMSVPQRLVG